MGVFESKTFNSTDINNGQKYEMGDVVSAQAINAPIEAALLLQALATNPPLVKISSSGNTSVSINNKPQFVFNLVVNSELSSTSIQPVQNQTIYAELEAIKEMINSSGGSGGGSITVDDRLLPSSTNPVQNAVVYRAINNINYQIGDVSALLNKINEGGIE